MKKFFIISVISASLLFLLIVTSVSLLTTMPVQAKSIKGYHCTCKKYGIQCQWKSRSYYKWCPNCKKSGHKVKLKSY